MAATVSELQVKVSADTREADSGLSTLSSKITGIGGALSTAFAGAAVGAIAGVGAGLAGAVTAAAGFEKTMSGVKAVSGATAEEFAALSAKALQIGKDTSFGASEAAQGIEELVKAGVPIAEVINGAADATAALAAAGGVGLKEAAEIASNAMNAFSISGADMARVSDIIAGAVNASAIEMNDFKFSLASVGAVAATIGLSFDDTAKSIALLGQAGIKGSDAGTSLKTMLLGLIPSTNQQKDLFRELGLESTNVAAGLDFLRKNGIEPTGESFSDVFQGYAKFLGLGSDATKWTKEQTKEFDKLSRSTGLIGSAFFDANGKIKPMAEIAQILNEVTKDMTEQQKLATLEIMFGTDALRASAIMAEAGAAGFDKVGAAMEKVTAADVAKTRLDNLAGAFEALKGSLETAAIVIGAAFLPALRGIVEGVTGVLNDAMPAIEHFATEVVRQMGDAFRTVQQVFGEGWEPSEVVDPFVNAVGEIALAFRDQIIPATHAAGQALSDLFGVLQENRGIIAAVAVGIGAFVVLTTVAGWITSAVAAFGALSAAITASGSVIGVIVAALGGPLTIALAAVAAAIALLYLAWTENWGGIQEIVAAALPAIQGVIESAMAAIEQVITAVMGRIAPFLIAQFQTVVDWVESNWPLIEQTISTVFTAIEGFFQRNQETTQGFITTVQGFWTAHGAELQTITEAMWTAITTFIETTLQTILGLLTATMQAINGDWEASWTTVSQVIQRIWAAIQTTIDQALLVVQSIIAIAMQAIDQQFGQTWQNILQAISQTLARMAEEIGRWMDRAVEIMSRAMQALARTVQPAIDAIDSLLSAAQSLYNWLSSRTFRFRIDLPELPDWARPGSPTPFEIGLRGIASAMKQLDRLEVGPLVAGASASVGAGAGGTPSLPLPATRAPVGGGITVNINAPVYGVQHLQDVVVESILAANRRGRLTAVTP